MHFIKINTNPYKWGIFYLLVQALVFVLMAIYVYDYDLRAFQLPLGLSLLCLAITFVLLTSQGRENSVEEEDIDSIRKRHKKIKKLSDDVWRLY